MLSVAPAGCAPGPQRHRRVRELNFYHQVQLRRQHLPAAQDAHHGGAQQHVRVAALVHRAGESRVVHFVETLHGLVAVVLSALQQVMHGHGAAVVVDVVAALAVGEDLRALDEAGGVGRGWGQRVGAVRVPDAEGACSARLPKCLLGTVPARHCACSAHLPKCQLGTVPARHIYLGACSAPPRLAKFSKDVRPTAA